MGTEVPRHRFADAGCHLAPHYALRIAAIAERPYQAFPAIGKSATMLIRHLQMAFVTRKGK